MNVAVMKPRDDGLSSKINSFRVAARERQYVMIASDALDPSSSHRKCRCVRGAVAQREEVAIGEDEIGTQGHALIMPDARII
jgi:hypothetical protein